jgi:apolipoprotein N-acyltransferase
MNESNAPNNVAQTPAIPIWQALVAFAASVALMSAAFLPQSFGVPVWFALVPALFFARRLPLKRLFWLSWAAGYAHFLLVFYWILIVSVPGGLALPIYLGLYWPAFFVAVEFLARRLRVPRLVTAVTLWPILEFVRGTLMTGLPWFYLGHALYRWPRLIQSADLGGVLLVSTIVIAANALIVSGLANPRRAVAAFACAAALFAANLSYGAWCFQSLEVTPGPTVACVQPNVPQDMKLSPSERDSTDIFLRLRKYTLDEKARSADVVLWPETIMPGLCGVDDYEAANGMTRTEILDELALQGLIDADKRAAVTRLLDSGTGIVAALTQVAGDRIVAHLMTYDLLAATPKIAAKPLISGAIFGDVDSKGFVKRTFNRAYQFDASGAEIARYDKVHLVPFGEFIPFRDTLPALSELIAKLMPVKPVTYPGGDFKVFDVGPFKFAPAICFEDTFSYVARRYRLLGADVLLNLTNDGWFAGSFELDAHLGNAVFRAVETRMAVVRAANTGISAVVSPRGVVTARLTDSQGRSRQVQGLLVAPVPVSPARTIYVAIGDLWLAGAAAVLACFCIAGRAVRREKTAPFCP